MRRHILIAVLLILLFAQVASAMDAVIAYRSDTNQSYCTAATAENCPKIRFWNSSASSGNGSWGPEIELSTSDNPVNFAVIKASPVSQKLVLVTLSDDDNLDGYVCMSNCSSTASWQRTTNIGNVATSAVRSFDVEFETSTGDAILVYAIDSTNTSRDLAYKILPSANTNFSSSSEQYINDAGGEIDYTWVRLDRKPMTSQELLLVAFDASSATEDINAWVWDGSAWGNQTEISNDASDTSGGEALAVRYSADGTKGMVIGANGSDGNVAYRYWNGAAWSAVGTFDVDTGGTADDVAWLNLKADPMSDDLQAIAVDDEADLTAIYWNGTTWNVTSNIDTGLDTETERPADFDWLPSGSTGRLVWDTDTTGTNLSQRICSPICNGSTSTISSYAGSGNWLTLFRNPTASDSVKILGLRLYSIPGNDPILSFRFNGTDYANYGNAGISTDVGDDARESYSLAFLLIGGDMPPNIVLSSPPPGYITNETTMNFSFTATDDNSTTMNCSLWIDNSMIAYDPTVGNGSLFNFSVLLSENIHFWNIKIGRAHV